MQIIKMKRVILLLMSLFVTYSVNAQIKDFVILGGELSNSAATSVSDIDEVLPRMKALGLNTVLVPVYWVRRKMSRKSSRFRVGSTWSSWCSV